MSSPSFRRSLLQPIAAAAVLAGVVAVAARGDGNSPATAGGDPAPSLTTASAAASAPSGTSAPSPTAAPASVASVSAAAATTKAAPAEPSAPHAPGEILIKFRPGARASERDRKSVR